MNVKSVCNPKPRTGSRNLHAAAKTLVLFVLTVVAAAAAAGFSAPEAQASSVSCRYLSTSLYACRWYNKTTETIISSTLQRPGYYMRADEAVYRWNGRTWALWALQRNFWYQAFNWSTWEHQSCEIVDPYTGHLVSVRDGQGILNAVACVRG